MLIPSILLIDDDEIDTELVRRAFQQHKIANPLIHVTDGLSALALLRGEPGVVPLRKPYLILLDMNMPRMNGLEFLHELRQDPVLQSSVVFMLTTSEDEQELAAAYAEGIAGYILKKNVGPDFVDALLLLGFYQTLVTLPT